MTPENLKKFRIILASKSPRRQYLLKGMALDFEVRTLEVDESFPAHLQEGEIALYLANHKAKAFLPTLAQDELLITADTIVWINDHVLNKPGSREEAIAMLSELSGQVHTVYTGVQLTTRERSTSFFDTTHVHFTTLTPEEIIYYVDTYQPFDKAGAYGAQDWIGLIGIDRLEGSYFNVMGLPVHRLYQELKAF